MARIKDVKKLGRLKAFKNMSVEQIKKLKLNFDGKPLSNYMINKYIKPQIQNRDHQSHDISLSEAEQQPAPERSDGPKPSRKRGKK